MHAQIYAAVALQQCPCEHRQCHNPVAHDQSEKRGDSKGVGGMARHEPVQAAAVAVDDMDHRLQRRVMGGTQTLHQMLDQA